MLQSVLLIFVVMGFFVLLAVGPAAIWAMVFGPPDCGPVLFDTFRRPKRVTDVLFAPRDYCENAVEDGTTPDFDIGFEALQARMREMLEKEPRVQLIDSNGLLRTDRYIVRSALLQLPDTVSIRYIELSPSRSTLAIYSRSQIFNDRFAPMMRTTQLARINRWLENLGVINQPNVIAFPSRNGASLH